jgi:hypothetical protein
MPFLTGLCSPDTLNEAGTQQVTMAEDSRHPRDLSPDEVASRVAEILFAAERDARAIIDAARREGPAPGEPGRTPQRPSTNGASATPDMQASLQGIEGALQALSMRVAKLEAMIEDRPEPSDVGGPRPATPNESRPEAGHSARSGESAAEVQARAERVRAVELALRGFTRSQIAAELRFTLPSQEIEVLLNEVLEGP